MQRFQAVVELDLVWVRCFRVGMRFDELASGLVRTASVRRSLDEFWPLNRPKRRWTLASTQPHSFAPRVWAKLFGPSWLLKIASCGLLCHFLDTHRSPSILPPKFHLWVKDQPSHRARRRPSGSTPRSAAAPYRRKLRLVRSSSVFVLKRRVF